MDEKLKELYSILSESRDFKGIYASPEDLASTLSDDGKIAEFYNILNSSDEFKGIFANADEFKNSVGLKKKSVPLESAQKGETILQDFGLPSKEPITPKLPYQSPKVNYEETLPDVITPTSVMKSNVSKGKFLEQKQTELSEKIGSDFEKENKKLKSDYEKKLTQEGTNKKQLEEEYKVRVDDLKLRKEKEASNEWDKMLDPDNYEYLAPEDVKGLGKEIDKILSQPMPFDKREASLNAIKDSFLSKVSILPADIQNTIKREINEVFARKTLFDEKGDVTPYGWKKEASQKLSETQGAKNRIQNDFKQKYPDFYEQITPTPSGGVRQGFSPSIDADPTKRQQFYADYEQYKKDLTLLGVAEEKLGNVMQTSDGSGSFADAFRMGGRDLLAAVSSVGWSDVAKALENNALSQKVQKGEKLSEGEQALFDTYGIFDAYQQGMQGSGYKLGNVFAQSLPMMESIASLNLMGVLGGAGTATLKQLAKKEGIKKLLTKGGAKLIGKEALNLGGAMAKGAPLTPLSWVRQQQGEAGQKILNDKGEWAIDKATVEGKVEATLKGLATGGTELGSEILGGYMGEFGQVLRNIPGLKNIKLPKVVGSMAKSAGIQGAPNEIAEEFINMLWQAPIGDQPLSEISLQDIWDTVWTTAGLTTILGSAALPGGIMNTVQRNRNYDVIKTFGKDAVAQVRDAIAEKDMGKLGDAIKSAFEGKTSESLGMDVETAQSRLLSYAKSIATEVVAKENMPTTTLEEIDKFIESEKTDEPIGTVTPLETKDGQDWYNVVNEQGQRDTFSVPEGSPQEVVQAKSEELVKPKIEEETKDAESRRGINQEVSEESGTGKGVGEMESLPVRNAVNDQGKAQGEAGEGGGITVYRGIRSEINEEGGYKAGKFVTDTKENAARYNPNIKEFTIPSNLKILSYESKEADNLAREFLEGLGENLGGIKKGGKISYDDKMMLFTGEAEEMWTNFLKNKGYDATSYINDSVKRTQGGKLATEYHIFDPKVIKPAQSKDTTKPLISDNKVESLPLAGEASQESVQKPAEFTGLEQTESKEAISATIPEKTTEVPPPVQEPPKVVENASEKEINESSYFRRVMGAKKPSKALKDGIAKLGLTYKVLEHAETSVDADYILSELGMEESEAALRDLNNGIPAPTRMALALRIGFHYDRMASEAIKGGYVKTENYYRDKTIAISDWIDLTGRDWGRGNSYQGSTEFMEMLSPETQVRKTKKSVRQDRDAKIKDNKEDLDKINKAHKKANEDAVNELLNSKEFEALKKRIAELEQKLTQKEEPKPPKDLPKDKIAKIKKDIDNEWARFKKAGKSSASATIIGLNAEQIEALGNIVAKYVQLGVYKTEDLILRLKKDYFKHTGNLLSDDDARKLLPDKIDGKSLKEIEDEGIVNATAEKLTERVKRLLEDPKVKKDDPIKQLLDTLFTKIEEKDTKEKVKPVKKTNIEKIREAISDKKRYADVWEAAKEKVVLLIESNAELSEEQKSDQLKRLQSFFEEVIGKPYAGKQVGGAITETAKELDINLNNVIKQHYTVIDATGRTLADKIIEVTGLKGDEANILATEIQSQFNKLVTEKKKRWLENDIKAKAKRKTHIKQAKAEFEKLIELTNLGAFSDADFAELYADAWGFPKLSEDQVQELERLAGRIYERTGFKKNEATQDYLNYVAKLPGLDMGEVAMMVWYSSVLQGLRTQGKNALGSLTNTLGELTVSTVNNLRKGRFAAIAYDATALWKAVSPALNEFGYVMKTGYSPVRNNKYETGNTAELWKFTGSWNPLNYIKYYPGRFMAATDAFFYMGLKEMRAHDLAMREAILNNHMGKPTTADWAKANEILNQTSERKAEAEELAKEEGLKGVEYKKRVYEIMEQGRPQEIIAESAIFASRGTFNYKPEGMLGKFADVIGSITSNYGKVKIHNPYTGKTYTIRAAKFIVPFTRIVANVANTAIDYTPGGFVRGWRGEIGSQEKREAQFYRKYTEEEKQRLYIKAALGTTSMALAFILSQPGDDGEEPIIQITANGTGKFAKSQLTKDWQPYSIKIGNKWWSYQYTPLFLALAPIGFIRDQQRFGKEENINDNVIGQVVAASLFSLSVVTDMSAISQAAGLLKMISDKSTQSFDYYIKTLGSGVAKGFVAPKGIEQVKQYYDDIADNPQKYSSKFTGKVIKDMPFMADKFPVRYNSYGEPIPIDAFQLTDKDQATPFHKFMTSNNAFFEIPKQESAYCTIFDQEKGIERPMDDWEFMNFVKLSGEEIKRRVTNEVMPKKLSPEDVRKEVSNIVTDVRKQVKTELFGWGDFRSDPKNQKAWETLKANGAIQVPPSTIQDAVISDTSMYSFTEEDVKGISKRAMELYAPEMIKYINSTEGKTAKGKIIMTPQGRILEYDKVKDMIWSGAMAQAKGELLEKKAKK